MLDVWEIYINQMTSVVPLPICTLYESVQNVIYVYISYSGNVHICCHMWLSWDLEISLYHIAANYMDCMENSNLIFLLWIHWKWHVFKEHTGNAWYPYFNYNQSLSGNIHSKLNASNGSYIDHDLYDLDTSLFFLFQYSHSVFLCMFGMVC